MFYFKLFANFCLLILANHAVQSQTLHEEHQFGSMFHEFIQTHKRDYKTQAEHKNRLNIFVQNMKKADALQKSQLGTATYGVTQFSDFTEAEFKQRYSGLNNRLGSLNSFPTAKIPNLKLPKHFDWRKKHVISEVKNQGLCSSCWAFSTTGNIESQWAIKHKKVLSLSEQELIDCDTGSSGCSGGLMTQAYETIIRLGGLEKEINYPYAEVNGSRCEFNKSKVVVKISGAVIIPSNELQMAKWLVKHGPINIGLNFADMQLYQKGIAHPNSTFCNHENLNHAVLLVGFGVQNKIPYWIAKNSWGSKWGEKGYYRIYRGDNTCGLNQMASSAVL